MKEFKHANVLTLVGVGFKGIVPMLVFPFMENGDLLTYIRTEDNRPTVKDLLQFAIDVGNGMAYLSTMRYVHCDLAARNCMMDQNRRIKVAGKCIRWYFINKMLKQLLFPDRLRFNSGRV